MRASVKPARVLARIAEAGKARTRRRARSGAAVLVRGSPSQWSAAQPGDAVVINTCTLAE
ncbi:MAG TPA: hypothetical protein VND87_03100 [Stellaceae bacterium]|nr:hypothetical protein [Stellaceae bacterium]